MGHHRPFLSRGRFNVATDQRAQARLRLPRETGGEDHDLSQRASLAIDRRVGPIVIVPDLDCSERDEKAEEYTQRGQDTGRDGLERACPLARREDHDDCIDCGRDEVSDTD
jgi:hypothetical protein